MSRPAFSVCALVPALLLATPRDARAEGPTPPASLPLVSEDAGPEYPPPETRLYLMAGGLATTGLFYGAAAGISFAYEDTPGAKELRIPVVGPWLSIANNGCPAYNPDCDRIWVVLRTIAAAIDGVAQAGGLGLILEGALLPTQIEAPAPGKQAPTLKLPRPNAPSNQPKTEPPPKNLFFVPLPMAVGSNGVGLGVVGRF